MNPDGFPEFRQSRIEDWEQSFNKSFNRSFEVRVHEIPLLIRPQSSELIRQLRAFFPEDWQVGSINPIQIDWISPDGGKGAWDSIRDPQCFFQNDFVSQRDFLAREVTSHHYQLMAHEKIDDGIFNFLRYLLPLKLIRKQKILFHSSAVVDGSGQARVFFGPSGAGKSTISELCARKGAEILGDDMNILSFNKDHRLLVEAGTLGQRFYSPQLFGKTWPVEGLFWLEKSKEFSHEVVEAGRLSMLFSSFANLFWDQLKDKKYVQLFYLLGKISQNQKIYRLRFRKTEEVWDYVQSIK